MTFFLVSVIGYTALVAWLADRVQATPAEWAFTLGHLVLAAALNAYLLRVARLRSLSLLGSAPLVFLLVSQIYFTVNGLKYFSPILLFPQFELSLGAQFLGSVAGGVVLFLCASLLLWQRGPTSERMLDWLKVNRADLRRLMVVTSLGSLGSKALLIWLGYGSAYTDTAYNEAAVRSYGDFFILLANDTFGLLSMYLGLVFLLRPRGRDRYRPLSVMIALAAFMAHFLYALVYLRARMILLVAFVMFAAASEVRSRKLAERALKTMFVSLPALSMLGVQLTLLLGRVNLPEDTSTRLAIAAVNRRADLTDFATAIVVNSGGQAHDAGIITSAILNAVPRVLLPDKEALVKDVYSDVLGKYLGWPAYVDHQIVEDYQDSAFSAGVMSLGIPGFVLVPMGLILLFYAVSRWLERKVSGPAYGLAMMALWLSALRVEIEWANIPFSFRQALMIGLASWILLATIRSLHGALVVAAGPRRPLIGAALPRDAEA